MCIQTSICSAILDYGRRHKLRCWGKNSSRTPGPSPTHRLPRAPGVLMLSAVVLPRSSKAGRYERKRCKTRRYSRTSYGIKKFLPWRYPISYSIKTFLPWRYPISVPISYSIKTFLPWRYPICRVLYRIEYRIVSMSALELSQNANRSTNRVITAIIDLQLASTSNQF